MQRMLERLLGEVGGSMNDGMTAKSIGWYGAWFRCVVKVNCPETATKSAPRMAMLRC